MQSEGKTDCHVVITNGMLNYCADSAHAYAGKSIPMTDWKEPEGDSDLPDESLPEDASDE